MFNRDKDFLTFLQVGDSFYISGGQVQEIYLRGYLPYTLYNLSPLTAINMNIMDDISAELPSNANNDLTNWRFTIIDGAALTLTRLGNAPHNKMLHFEGGAGDIGAVTLANTHLEIKGHPGASFTLASGGTGWQANPQLVIGSIIIWQETVSGVAVPTEVTMNHGDDRAVLHSGRASVSGMLDRYLTVEGGRVNLSELTGAANLAYTVYVGAGSYVIFGDRSPYPNFYAEQGIYRWENNLWRRPLFNAYNDDWHSAAGQQCIFSPYGGDNGQVLPSDMPGDGLWPDLFRDGECEEYPIQ